MASGSHCGAATTNQIAVSPFGTYGGCKGTTLPLGFHCIPEAARHHLLGGVSTTPANKSVENIATEVVSSATKDVFFFILQVLNSVIFNLKVKLEFCFKP